MTGGAVGQPAGSWPGKAGGPVEDAANVLLRLAEQRPVLATSLARLVTAIGTEAMRSTQFGTALESVLTSAAEPVTQANRGQPRRAGRRPPGPIDPFTIYASDGVDSLREVLFKLDLEQLRDIVAEHGMDHDKLAMKWKTPSRLIDRIVEKVASRTNKGSAFRSDT